MVADWRHTAEAVEHIGPAVAYVGFSMGAIFGAATVAALPGIKAVVLGVGGVPSGMGVDDPPLRALLLEAASKLGGPQLLMINMTGDDFVRPADAHAFFDRVPGRRKRLVFWDGPHDDWPAEAIQCSVAFITEHATT